MSSVVLVFVLDWTMSPARSRCSASHAMGTHGWLPQKTWWPGLRRGGIDGYNLHSPLRLWLTNHVHVVSVWCLSLALTLASSLNCQYGVVVCGPLFVVYLLIVMPCHLLFHPCLYSESTCVKCSVYSIEL